MIKEGCLKGVDEVYGLHNFPDFDEGDIRVCSGPFMAAFTGVHIKIKGQGGHGSIPHRIQDVISCATQIFQALHTIKSRSIESRQDIVFVMCKVKAGHTYNVFPDEALMSGAIRSYDEATLDKMIQRIKTISVNIAKGMKCKVELDIQKECAAVVNHVTESDHI